MIGNIEIRLLAVTPNIKPLYHSRTALDLSGSTVKYIKDIYIYICMHPSCSFDGKYAQSR